MSMRLAGHVLLVLALAFLGLSLPAGPVRSPDAPAGMGAPSQGVGLPPDAQVGGLPPALAVALRHGVTHVAVCPSPAASHAPVPGRGSRFQLRTPRVPAAAPAAASLPGALLHAPFAVALLEDDPLVREAMASLLERHGMEIASGADSQELCGVLRRTGHRPDLIIADYQLRGGESGVEAVRLVRRIHGEAVPVILMTGQTSAEHLAEAEASGFPLLRKPVQGGKLLALIRATLSLEEAGAA